jgi:hypothetical protein
MNRFSVGITVRSPGACPPVNLPYGLMPLDEDEMRLE